MNTTHYLNYSLARSLIVLFGTLFLGMETNRTTKGEKGRRGEEEVQSAGIPIRSSFR